MYYEPNNSYFFYPYNRNNSYYKSKEIKTLRVDGTSNVKATPDTASIILGIQTENTDLETAQNENTIIATRVINSLKSIGINEESMNTDSYAIEPLYDYIDGKQTFKTYRVTNNIKVITMTINSIGTIVDTATANGVNIINNISFFLSNPTPYYRKTLNLAVEDALIRARSISNSLGVTLNETPINIVESRFDQPSSSARNPLVFAAASTPILPGQLNITAHITATFNYQ
ncbi:hypothetical protein CPAST_c39460 [Clostridium pasteurianum DSM 525 = ATCC 6013]|uniref:26 kDa periplasmic immunogenic protein n=1 Tax=Clostridium pasteurianum DSM 525 = ATCC 6013 TaxID=1262449 RepID=A0A0H3J906_CLOPA|nr:SIMPL domain-containing protein [Clostridium pasteurianum]AJA49984.1 hypothetical protein CPAST_c39460 [Clostridium pasteurianum DSM 525 = ATCC 6013]AJA53972.1 hypothetical protein CLPA_c39460 [Clostridium pasteurianum DSM 525 = ATCC 6013]AOZ77117.1 hypothetical protein AQ983_19190 [Clostridium pasteurianum DSM 525 = ATCC 6013]AOZ80914.1 hypothetical protein AQ984_19185 [Clostridium pasteurianum]ELP59304.1 periplasmic immunogenic protein [Clostridium pasteurianum DSM 525 = ATCC 6013]